MSRLEAELAEEKARKAVLPAVVEVQSSVDLKELTEQHRRVESPVASPALSPSPSAGAGPVGSAPVVGVEAQELQLENSRLKTLLDTMDLKAAEAEDKLQAAAELQAKFQELQEKFRESQEALARFSPLPPTTVPSPPSPLSAQLTSLSSPPSSAELRRRCRIWRMSTRF